MGWYVSSIKASILERISSWRIPRLTTASLTYMRVTKVYGILVILLLTLDKASAQAGLRDASFRLRNVAIRNSSVLTVQQDDKILVEGYDSVQSRFTVLRLLPDGALDTSFNSQLVLDNGWSEQINKILVLRDGSVLVAGSFLEPHFGDRPKLARLWPDGRVDTSFHTQGFNAFGSISELAEDSTGRYYVGGNFYYSYGSFSQPYLIRLLPNGLPDASFSTTGWGNLDGTVNKILLEPTHTLLLAGSFTYYRTGTATSVMRLNNSGWPDPSFSVHLSATLVAQDVLQVPGGKIMLANPQAGLGTSLLLLRNNGERDSAYPTPYPNACKKVLAQSDGKIVGIDQVSTASSILYRLKADGSLDPSFQTSTSPFQYSTMAFQSGNRLLVGRNPFFNPSWDTTTTIFRVHLGNLTPVLKTDKPRITLSPNPAQEALYIRTNDCEIHRVTLTDGFGRTYPIEYRVQEHALEIAHLTKGLYMLGLQTNSGVVHVRFVKE